MVIGKRARVNIFSLVVLGVFVVASLYFVLAASNAPTALTFGQNTSTNFDKEGNFTVNWTAPGAGDAPNNYSIYISVNGGTSYYTKAWNNSATGYTFSNSTNTNYTFKIGSVNATGTETNASALIFMVVDTINPAILYGAGLADDNANVSRTWIFANVSASDTNNHTITFFLYNSTAIVNQTSYTNSYATLTINWTGLAQGTYYYNVTANDSATNSNSTSTRTITLDTTAPTITLPVYTNGTFKQNTNTLTLNISISDALSGLTGSACIIDINGTNQTIFASNGWCNTTNGNLTGLVDGNRTINVYANDTVGNLALNNSFVVQIDTSAPTVTLPTYTNGTFKQNTSTLTLNISLADAGSGLTGSACFININGTNQTIFASNGWCNTTNGNLTGLVDGNRTINVYANDTVGNLALNNSFVVQMDTTAPSASASCTPATVYSGNTVTCTCSGSDATSGVASSTATSTPSTVNTGTFSYDCTVIDNAGNSASNSDSYVVELSSSGGSSGGGGSITSNFWTGGTTTVTNEQFISGYSKEMLVKQRVMVSVAETSHYVGVREVSATTAKIEVTSTPQEKILLIGEEWKVEVTGDNFYDLSVKLTSIQNSKANVFVQSIYEAMPVAEPAPEEVVPQDEQPTITGEATEGETEAKSSLLWLWLLIAIVVVAFVVWIIYYRKHRK